MAGNQISTSYDGLGYAFDKVIFQAGKPPLDVEMNLSQELQEILTQKSTAHMSSGWMSYRPPYTSSELVSAFYTQDPTGAKPEVALVNGWPVYVTNTGVPQKHVNKVDLSGVELRAGTRVDGVFLEVWRSEIAPDTDPSSTAKPQPLTKVSDLHGVQMFNENLGWAVGDTGVILKTSDGGVKWVTVNAPISVNFSKIRFVDDITGYVVGDKGTILKSVDGGESFFVIESPTTDNLRDLFVIDSRHTVAVGDNGTIVRTQDGSSFVLVTQVGGNTHDLHGVYFFDNASGWAVGSNGTLLITNDGGLIWDNYLVTDVRTGQPVVTDLLSVAFYNLNDGLITGTDGSIYRTSDGGFTWASVSDRIWTGTEYTTLRALFPTDDINLNSVVIKRDFPLSTTIAVWPDSRTYFKGITYEISPSEYPNSFVLRYTGTQDNINYVNVLNLDAYLNAEALSDAINSILSPYKASDVGQPDVDRQKVRVFLASVAYPPMGRPSDLRPTSGTISSLRAAEVTFSVQDKAWIAGSNGHALVTYNSGAKWELVNIAVGNNLYDVSFLTDTIGWYVGSDGMIIGYDGGTVTVQSSELTTLTVGRIFPEGNVLSQAAEYLPDNIIDPQVGVETTRRVQIQYRIRIVDGVDPIGSPDSGLGMPFVYSLGPNLDEGSAGTYAYENMGSENGDYGLWRARCRSTYDGYSWAIPMFFVTRRNSGAFSQDSNPNGSTYFDMSAVRPDGLAYQQIAPWDVADVRRQVVINSLGSLLQKNTDRVLSNKLRTNLADRGAQGAQYGTEVLMSDSLVGPTEVQNLVRGGVSSEAILVKSQKLLDPNITITTQELTFGPIENGLFHNEFGYYSAIVVRDGVPTQEPVQGTFEGLGTDTVVFNIAQDYAPQGGSLEGVQYQITAYYFDYSVPGLSRVPQEPVSIKYIGSPTDPTSVYFYNGVSARAGHRVLETLASTVPGYSDFVMALAPVKIQANDTELYELVGHKDLSDPMYKRGLQKYHAQQFRGSPIEYHYFIQTTTAVTTIRIPKNLNGYSILGVRRVVNVNGTSYKISSNFVSGSVLDRETVDTVVVKDNIVVKLDEAFVIPANTTVEVICEALNTAAQIQTGGTDPLIGPNLPINRGETQNALRGPWVSSFDVGSKGVAGIYMGALYPLNLTSAQSILTINLATSSIPALINSTVIGMASYETKQSVDQLYVWYSPNPSTQAYTTVPVATVAGFGTSIVTLTLDPQVSVYAGTVLVPLFVKQDTVPALEAASSATMFYRYVPYQALGNLPDRMLLEPLYMPDFVYVSNMGTGASRFIKGEPYEVPVEQIAVADQTVVTDNWFTNADDLDFAGFSLDGGFIKLPARIQSGMGDDITLSGPQNVGDRVGRPYYTACDKDIVFEAEGCVVGAPRKVFVPVLARVRSDMTAPVARGEVVLLIMSKVYKARLENKTGFYDDDDVEYKPGYFETTPTAVSVYRIMNRPMLRK